MQIIAALGGLRELRFAGLRETVLTCPDRLSLLSATKACK